MSAFADFVGCGAAASACAARSAPAPRLAPPCPAPAPPSRREASQSEAACALGAAAVRGPRQAQQQRRTRRRQTCRGSAAAAVATAALAVQLLSPGGGGGGLFAAAEPCLDSPKEYGIVQFTAEECRCCFDLDEFIQDNDYVYVLFYSTKGRLNIDINAKFEQLAAEWKWSRIHFGRIDVDKDREMAKKWNEPHMVPTNVMYKFGRPVEVKPTDFEQIRDRYQGSPEGIKWMLTKYLGEDSEGSNIHYITPLMSAKKHGKLLKNNEISLVGFFRKENDLNHKIFQEAAWNLHQAIDRDDIGAGLGAVTTQSVSKKLSAQVPSIVAYIDGKAVEEEGAFISDKWTVKAVTAFLKQFLPLAVEDGVGGAGGNPREDL